LRAADEAHQGHAEAVRVERAPRGLEQARVVAEPQVVVRAEVHDLAPGAHPDVRALGARDHALALAKARLVDRAQFGGESFADGGLHRGLPEAPPCRTRRRGGGRYRSPSVRPRLACGAPWRPAATLRAP